MSDERDRIGTEVDAGTSGMAEGLLFHLVSGLRQLSPGQLLALTTRVDVAEELESWSLMTGHPIVSATERDGATRWLIQ